MFLISEIRSLNGEAQAITPLIAELVKAKVQATFAPPEKPEVKIKF